MRRCRAGNSIIAIKKRLSVADSRFYLVVQIPVDGGNAFALQISVRFAERLTAEKSVVGGKWGRMNAFYDTMLFAVNQGLFAPCVATPKNKHDRLFTFR